MGSCTRAAPAITHGGDSPAQAAGREAFRELERWLGSESSQRLGLPAVERETECRGQEVLRLLLQEHIDRRGSGDVGVALQVAASDGGSLLYTHRRLHTRNLITRFGQVSITRAGYGRPGERWIHPLDAELQLPARVYSYEVQRRVVKAAVQGLSMRPSPSSQTSTESTCRNAAPSRSSSMPVRISRPSMTSAVEHGANSKAGFLSPRSTPKASPW